MTILITGGAGFIGANLVDELLGDVNNKVVVIDNFNNFYDFRIKERNIEHNLSNRKFILYRNDILNLDVLNNIFLSNKIDIIVHLAGYGGVRPSIDNPKMYIDNNITGTLNILECMRIYKVKKMVYASSSSVYGNSKQSIFSEGLKVSEPLSPYAMTKLACEQLSYTYHKLYNLNIIALRFFTVYGRRQRPDLAIYKFAHLISKGEPITVFGDGTSKRDYTYIDDIINGILSAINYDNTPYEIINIGGGEPVELNKMIEVIENILGKKAIIERIGFQRGEVNKTFADISKAEKLLNYKPSTKFVDGIKIFLEWYKDIVSNKY